jgi:hypothetical protein
VSAALLLVLLLGQMSDAAAIPMSARSGLDAAIAPTPPIALQTPAPAPVLEPAGGPLSTGAQASFQRMIQAALAASMTSRSAPQAGTAASSSSSAASSSSSSSSSSSASFDSTSIARSLNDLAQQLRQQREPQLPAHSLLDILAADRVLPLLSPADIASLLPHLPSVGTEQSAEGIAQHMRSAQFAQVLGRMDSVLRGEAYGGLIGSLGLSIGSGDGGFGVEGLIDAINRLVRKERQDRDSSAAADEHKGS